MSLCSSMPAAFCLLKVLLQPSAKPVLDTTPAAQHPVKHAAHQASLVKGLIRCKGGKTLYLPDAGYNDVKDDESMGWARYAHSMRVFVINSGLFYIRPTQASIELLDRITQRLNTENGWDQAIFNEVCIANPLLSVNRTEMCAGISSGSRVGWSGTA